MVLNRGDRFSRSACCRSRGVVLLDGPNYDLARSPISSATPRKDTDAACASFMQAWISCYSAFLSVLVSSHGVIVVKARSRLSDR